MARAANIANDRPVGIRSLTNDDFVPVTPNQLLIGRTSTAVVNYEPGDDDNLTRRGKYQEELLQTWWNQYHTQVFSSLLPYQRYKDAKRHENLAVGDVCLVKADNKIRASYRLCRIVEVTLDAEGLVRTVKIRYRPRDKREKVLPYKYKEPVVTDMAIQKLVLICPTEELQSE